LHLATGAPVAAAFMGHLLIAILCVCCCAVVCCCALLCAVRCVRCQVMGAMCGVCRRAVLEADPRLVEALYLCQVQAAAEALSGVYAVLGRRRARILQVGLGLMSACDTKENTGRHPIHLLHSSPSRHVDVQSTQCCQAAYCRWLPTPCCTCSNQSTLCGSG
jgi:hypothetical protein